MTQAGEDMALFARIIERGTFALAASDAGLTPSALSKRISRLEDRLGVRLLQRTTRRLALTPEGETYLAHARGILAAIEAAEAETAQGRASPKGFLRINTGTGFGRHRLLPLLPRFLEAYPDIRVAVDIADRRVDPVAAQADMVIRTGPLDDSTLVARKIADSHRVICASPAYLARRGTPGTPADLAAHECMTLTGFSALAQWPFSWEGRKRLFPVSGRFASDNVDMLLSMALNGAGLVRLGAFVVADSLASGALARVLEDCHLPETLPITALMPPGRLALPRVRAFLDFIIANSGAPAASGAPNGGNGASR